KRSTTEKCVVLSPSRAGAKIEPKLAAAAALAGAMRARTDSAKRLDVGWAGGGTPAGWPRKFARAKKAAVIPSTKRWVRVAASAPPRRYPSRMFSISTKATPPEEDGGIETMR